MAKRDMTNEEAIRLLKTQRIDGDDLHKAFDMAIKALEQEPILDKIRAEIVELQKDYQEYGWVYDDALELIDKYKAEIEKGAAE